MKSQTKPDKPRKATRDPEVLYTHLYLHNVCRFLIVPGVSECSFSLQLLQEKLLWKKKGWGGGAHNFTSFTAAQKENRDSETASRKDLSLS